QAHQGAHLVDEGDALGLGRHEYIGADVLEALGQRRRGGLDDVGIAEHVEHGDAHAGRDLEEREVTDQAGHFDRIGIALCHWFRSPACWIAVTRWSNSTSAGRMKFTVGDYPDKEYAMKAITIYGEKNDPRLVWEDVADIGFTADEVLVDVRATAVNRADLSQARGHYPPPPGASDILGLEMAGVIREVGASVGGWRAGDRVCALLPGGGYAERAAVPAGMLIRLPDDWSFAQGAAVPEVWYTAYINLFDEGQLKAGETALIHA